MQEIIYFEGGAFANAMKECHDEGEEYEILEMDSDLSVLFEADVDIVEDEFQ